MGNESASRDYHHLLGFAQSHAGGSAGGGAPSTLRTYKGGSRACKCSATLIDGGRSALHTLVTR